jgi:AcrR family transcriptional regulator
MGRPSLGQVRRPQILQAFEACLIRYGLEGTTLDRVAEEAGMTRGLVRYYLGNRDEVLRALGVHIRDRYSVWLQELVAADRSKDRLSSVLDALLLGHVPRDLYLVSDALFSVAVRDPELAAVLRETYMEFERTIDTELAAALPDADPRARRQVALAILCLAFATPDLRAMGFPADRQTAARSTADRLVESLR